MKVKKFYLTYLLLLLFVIAVSLSAGILAARAQGEVKILSGISIEGLDVGGLKHDEAMNKLIPIADRLLNRKIEIVYHQETWLTTFRELCYEADRESAVRQAMSVGHRENPLRNIYDKIFSRTKGVDVALPIKLNEEKAQKKLKELVREAIVQPVNARRVLGENDSMHIEQDFWGWDINRELMQEQLQRLTYFQGESASINLKLQAVKPQVTRNELLSQHITGLLASYSTSFDAQNINRTENIRLAAGAISGLLITPEEVFSFNENVGPRSISAGYKEAPVIVEGKLQPGLGGGVCQVSTTLYNTALRANLEIVERSRHSLPVGYVPLGTDATVSYGFLDLKIQNNSEGFLLLLAQVLDNRLIIKIYGWKEKMPGQIEIVAEKLTEKEPESQFIEDETLHPGEIIVEQEGRKGYQTRVRRIIHRGQKLLKEEIISEDYYPPETRVIKLSPGAQLLEGA